jgi:hypothetical protein
MQIGSTVVAELLRLLVSQEHGRTIPLNDIGCALRQWF